MFLKNCGNGFRGKIAMLCIGRVFWVAAVAWLCCVGAWAADDQPQVCLAIPAKQTPVLDGKIDETEWRDAEMTGGFSVLGRPKAVLAKATTFRVLYTAKALWIAIECREPDMAQVQTAKDDIWEADSVEIYIQQMESDPCWQAIVGVDGARAVYLIPEEQLGVTSLETKTFRGPDFYSVEMMIPFDLLGVQPQPGTVWRFNIARNATTPGADRYSTWSRLSGSFHEFEGFGKLLFYAEGVDRAAALRAFCEKEAEVLFWKKIVVIPDKLVLFDWKEPLHFRLAPLAIGTNFSYSNRLQNILLTDVVLTDPDGHSEKAAGSYPVAEGFDVSPKRNMPGRYRVDLKAVESTGSAKEISTGFWIIPDTGTMTKTSFSFVQIADLHVSSETEGKQLLERLAEMTALAEKPLFVVPTGDLVNGGQLSEYAAYRGSILRGGLPFFNVIGNHDQPIQNFQTLQREENYSFDIGNKHFVSLNCMSPEWPKWLKNHLEGVPKDRPIYVFQHYDPSKALLDMLAQYNVKAMFFGHWHSNKAFRYGNMLVFSTPPPRFGGIDASPASFRLISVAPDGNLKTEMRLAGIRAHLVILDPVGQRLAGTPLRVRAAAYDTALRVREMQCRIDHGVWKDMNPAGGWLWDSAAIGEEMSIGKHMVSVRATTESGATWERESSFEVTKRQAKPRQVAYRLAWRQYVGGEHIVSAPVPSGNRVYTSVADNDNVEGSGLACLDATTGAILWKRPTDSPVNGAPALEDGVICAVSVVGSIYAWNAETGGGVWTNSLGDSYARWVYNSPVISSGVVFCGVAPRVVGLDLKTGENLWQTNGLGGDWISCRASPAVDDRFVYLGVNWNNGLFALNRQTGQVVWNRTNHYDRTHATPVARGENLFCAANDRLYALDRSTGNEIWSALPGRSWPVSSPAIDGNTIIMGSRNGKVVSFDAKNGRIRWSCQTGLSIGSFGPYQWGGSMIMGAPLIDGKKVYVGSNDGKIYVLDLRSGKELWSYNLGVPVTSSPAIAADRLYVTTFDGNIFAFQRE